MLSAKNEAIGVGLLTTTPPSIKPLCDGKYVGAAALARAVSITENSDVLLLVKLLKKTGSQEFVVNPVVLKAGINT